MILDKHLVLYIKNNKPHENKKENLVFSFYYIK